MLIWNSVGGLTIIIFHGITSAMLFAALNRIDLLRVTASAEIEGLDMAKHDEPAYIFGMYPSTFKLRKNEHRD